MGDEKCGNFEKVCRCGHWFASPDRDVTQCPDCVLHEMLLDDDEATPEEFADEYAEPLRAGWRRIDVERYTDGCACGAVRFPYSSEFE